MAHAPSDRLVRRIPAVGMAMLLASVLAGVALTRGAGDVPPPPPLPLQARDLRFADLADGGVAVSDARDGAPVAVIAPGEGGFLRGTVRGLVRDRRRAEAAPDAGAPFRLAAWPGGGLTLEDTATGRVLDLRAFGATNAGAFAALLTASRENAP